MDKSARGLGYLKIFLFLLFLLQNSRWSLRQINDWEGVSFSNGTCTSNIEVRDRACLVNNFLLRNMLFCFRWVRKQKNNQNKDENPRNVSDFSSKLSFCEPQASLCAYFHMFVTILGLPSEAVRLSEFLLLWLLVCAANSESKACFLPKMLLFLLMKQAQDQALKHPPPARWLVQ